ncbi:putative disease resistance protein RGA4 [Vitis vinifera]|uniref:Putative disease resistance protein RGA4 n=1 Tax=Vitis vinifera TaxID=29760 RepID=A0A438C6X0_VITVI|nr:putative disease resistance protein RGA4 [Vitis vinifera]
MADALLSIVLTRLASVVEQQIRDELTLVLGVEAEIQSLTDTLRSVRDVLEDAERRQVKEKSVQGWLERLKDMAYQMDDVVDEWSTAILQLQIKGAESASMSKKKVSSCIPSPCFCLKQVASRRDIALKVKSIKQQLDVIASQEASSILSPV